MTEEKVRSAGLKNFLVGVRSGPRISKFSWSADRYFSLAVSVRFLESYFIFYRPSQNKLGCVVRMAVDSILPHVESGPNDHRKEAPQFTKKVE